MTNRESTKFQHQPFVAIAGYEQECWQGWRAIAQTLKKEIEKQISAGKQKVVCAVECYPGVRQDLLEKYLVDQLQVDLLCRVAEVYLPEAEIEDLVGPELTDDPVFGRISRFAIEDFFDPLALALVRRKIEVPEAGLILVIGTGATLVSAADCIIYADIARWETQLRFRKNEIANLGTANFDLKWSLQYKRAYFLDWRVADKLKRTLYSKVDYWLDTNRRDDPVLLSGQAFIAGLENSLQGPFSVVPYFDTAPWGGQWMREKFGLDPKPKNFGWCFNCVPEENSLLLKYGDVIFETPSINLVFYKPAALLGEASYGRFGAEFPIRFDYLDTVGGGNLSFQVHPIHDYIREHFNMDYTQDESYYMMDAGPEGTVYLGLKEGVDRKAMMADLKLAQSDPAKPFDADKYVNRWPAKKHDHFLIPGGTPHCSGSDSVVLEISATPYIFTFKMWDWGRMGLDGSPRPVHLHHAEPNIQWERTTAWVKENLINTIKPVAEGEGWREEYTGLHGREPLETRRHWFTKAVPHSTEGSVNVLCLVDGDQVIVESPESSFEPFTANYGEVFIIPASVENYTIRPAKETHGQEFVTLKCFVRA